MRLFFPLAVDGYIVSVSYENFISLLLLWAKNASHRILFIVVTNFRSFTTWWIFLVLSREFPKIFSSDCLLFAMWFNWDEIKEKDHIRFYTKIWKTFSQLVIQIHLIELLTFITFLNECRGDNLIRVKNHECVRIKYFVIFGRERIVKEKQRKKWIHFHHLFIFILSLNSFVICVGLGFWVSFKCRTV